MQRHASSPKMSYEGHTEHAALSGWIVRCFPSLAYSPHPSEAIHHVFPKTSLDPGLKGPLNASMQLCLLLNHCLAHMAL